MENITNKKEFKKRVDIQVSLITAIITLTASLSIFGLCYTITYKDTINVLRDRANAVYEKVVANLIKPRSMKFIRKKMQEDSCI